LFGQALFLSGEMVSSFRFRGGFAAVFFFFFFFFKKKMFRRIHGRAKKDRGVVFLRNGLKGGKRKRRTGGVPVFFFFVFVGVVFFLCVVGGPLPGTGRGELAGGV